MNMYFVALVAPAEINRDVLKWKNFFKEKYQCIVALKSPAHITLIPPFWMKEELEADLIRSIEEFSHSKKPFPVDLKDFGAFKPTVIYVGVVKNEVLNDLSSSFTEFILSQDKFPVKKEDRPFYPHVTLAARDLYKKAFYEAWEVFAVKKYEAAWFVNGISLLRHNKKNWDVIFTSQLED
ncbi:MAG TPA: 2'-5' RNA ligase family protein [Chitinophagaceae bacterium]|nr:2'-5' RNA ligase family protein [Chitinophagaceae bacterium]